MSKFSTSLEAIPRQRSFACLSLKFGSIFSGLVIILYSIFALARCIVAFGYLPKDFNTDDFNKVFTYAVIIGLTVTHTLTLFLSTLLLVGIIWEKLSLMRPWIVWTSIQVCVSVIMFVLWSTFNLVSSGSGSLLLYIIEFLALMVHFYILMIVVSFYKQIEETGGETERLKNINIDNWYSA